MCRMAALYSLNFAVEVDLLRFSAVQGATFGRKHYIWNKEERKVHSQEIESLTGDSKNNRTA